MRIVDEGNVEITSPDLTQGELYPDRIVTEEGIEDVQRYIPYSEETIARREAEEEQKQQLAMLTECLLEMSEIVYAE